MFGASTFTVTDDSDHIYGKGVHAFFDRDYKGAVTILLQAEEIKSIDPRPFYFLGLAYLRQGKTEEAGQYFRQAAQLEFSGRGARDYGVAESLRRIQGADRQQIEQIRSEERTNARIREQQHQEARYSSEHAADRESLRRLPQNQREDLATLQRTAGNFGNNAFGVRPIDPINTAERSAVIRREDTNPFGEVTVTVSETPVVSASAPSTGRTSVTPSRTERQFINPNVPVVGQERAQSGSNLSPVRGAQAAVAKELGRGLGSLFSRRSGSE